MECKHTSLWFVVNEVYIGFEQLDLIEKVNFQSCTCKKNLDEATQIPNLEPVLSDYPFTTLTSHQIKAERCSLMHTKALHYLKAAACMCPRPPAPNRFSMTSPWLFCGFMNLTVPLKQSVKAAESQFYFHTAQTCTWRTPCIFLWMTDRSCRCRA